MRARIWRKAITRIAGRGGGDGSKIADAANARRQPGWDVPALPVTAGNSLTSYGQDVACCGQGNSRVRRRGAKNAA